MTGLLYLKNIEEVAGNIDDAHDPMGGPRSRSPYDIGKMIEADYSKLTEITPGIAAVVDPQHYLSPANMAVNMVGYDGKSVHEMFNGRTFSSEIGKYDTTEQFIDAVHKTKLPNAGDEMLRAAFLNYSVQK